MSPPALPVELLVQIISDAFDVTDGGSGSITPYTLLSPPPTHLLRVSRIFRSIAHPLFWSTVVITRREDWIALFDVRRGLLVGADDAAAKERRGWIKTLALSVDVPVPILTPADLVSSFVVADPSYRVPLNLCVFQQPVPHLVLLHPSRVNELRPGWYIHPPDVAALVQVEEERKDVPAIQVVAAMQAMARTCLSARRQSLATLFASARPSLFSISIEDATSLGFGVVSSLPLKLDIYATPRPEPLSLPPPSSPSSASSPQSDELNPSPHSIAFDILFSAAERLERGRSFLRFDFPLARTRFLDFTDAQYEAFEEEFGSAEEGLEKDEEGRWIWTPR